MKTLLAIFIAFAAVTCQAQRITGNMQFSGNMQITALDNCTGFICGDTNTATPAHDKNIRAWFASRVTGVAGTACRVAAVIGKTGNPTAQLSIALFTDNAGQPGTKLFESDTLSAGQIVSLSTNNWPAISWNVPASSLWIAIHASTTVSVIEAVDYFDFYNHYTGAVTDTLWVSDDAVTWIDGGGRGFLSVRLLRAQ